MTSTPCHSGKGKATETEKRLVVAWGLRGGRDESMQHRGFGGSKTILYAAIMLDYPSLLIC
jgi:hypothetical protein